jgi:hypothetical protein
MSPELRAAFRQSDLPMNFEPKSLHNDRRFTARSAPMIDFDVWQSCLSPVIR